MSYMWAIYGKHFGKYDYSCASISHRFRARLKILHCILSECYFNELYIYLCTIEEIWSWYEGLWLGRLMPTFNYKWLRIQIYLLTDYNTEVFINCESRLMSNLNIVQFVHEMSLLIHFLTRKSICPVFNSYSKLWDYENVTRTSNSQNMSHVLKIQEAHRPKPFKS